MTRRGLLLGAFRTERDDTARKLELAISSAINARHQDHSLFVAARLRLLEALREFAR